MRTNHDSPWQVGLLIVFTFLTGMWLTLSLANVLLPVGREVLSQTCNEIGLLVLPLAVLKPQTRTSPRTTVQHVT